MATRVYEPNPKGGGGQATIDTIFFYGAIGGGGWLAYTLALQGSLGVEAKKVALQLYKAFHGGAGPSGARDVVTTGVGTKTILPPLPAGESLPAPGNPGWFWIRRYPGWMWNPSLPEGEGDGESWYFGGIDNWTAQTGWT